jgi:aryl-alcohol dehydrogenase-like predicted oxidoreductase
MKLADVTVSKVGLGCRRFGREIAERDALHLIDLALDAGLNFFDTAPTYNDGQSEKILGMRLHSPSVRQHVVVATKIQPSVGARAADYCRQAEDCIRRLRSGWIDIWQIHFPAAPDDLRELLAAAAILQRQGLVRFFGTSNFSGAALRELLVLSREIAPAVKLVSEQSPYNLLAREIEGDAKPHLRSLGLQLFAWSPLAGGLLGGRYEFGRPPPSDSQLAARMSVLRTAAAETAIERLRALAQRIGTTLPKLALQWLIDQGVAVAIVGAHLPEHIADCGLLSRGHAPLDQETQREIDSIVSPAQNLSHFKFSPPGNDSVHGL